MVRQRFQPEYQLWRLYVRTVDVQIIGSHHLRAVQFRSSYKDMDQAIHQGESGCSYVLEQVGHARQEKIRLNWTP